MSIDVRTQLAEYGKFHEEEQRQVTAEEIGAALTRMRAASPKPNYALRRTVAGILATAGVVLLIGIPAVLFGGSDQPETPVATEPLAEPGEPTTAVTSTAETAPIDHPGYAQVVESSDGTLYGLKEGTLWRSDDQGRSWAIEYEQSYELDVLLLAPDGAVLVVRNHNSTTEALGAGSNVNVDSEIHRRDPVSGQWEVAVLPRPPVPTGLEPASSDPAESECPISGLQDWVDGIAAVYGDRIVVLATRRLVAAGICDKDSQYLWTSTDGLTWEVSDEIDIDGALATILWTGERYVGVGSDRPYYVGGGGPVPVVWTSTNLVEWTRQSLDVSDLPADGFVSVPAPVFLSFEGANAINPVLQADGEITLSFPVQTYRPGLADVASLDELRAWLDDASYDIDESDFSLEEQLGFLDVDFPLDEAEIRNLNGLYDLKVLAGTLTLVSSDGINWTSFYDEEGSG